MAEENELDDYVNMDLYFSEFSFDRNTETADKDWVPTLSTVGGSLGPCLGTSLISVVELFELFGILLRRWDRRRARARRLRQDSLRKKLVEEERSQEMEDNAARGESTTC